MTLFKFHPGETFVINFTIPFHEFDVKAVLLSFRDRDHVVFETMATSFIQEGNKLRIGYMLTEGESLLFEENRKYKMQLNVLGGASPHDAAASRMASKELDVQTLSQQITTTAYSSRQTYESTPTTGHISNEGAVSYNDLIDKPSINDQILIGNRKLPENRITEAQIDELLAEEGE